MAWLAGLMVRVRRGGSVAALGLGGLLFACGAASGDRPATPRYEAHFDAQLEPDTGSVQVTLRIDQPRALVLSLDFRMPEARYEVLASDGTARREAGRVIWRVPERGGSFSYRYRIDNRRVNGAYDARLTPGGGLFRGDDVFPAATVLTDERARSISYARIQGPKDWSVETRYGNTAQREVRVFDAQRRFDRPTGWMLAGPLGIRRDDIADTRVSVAAIRGERLRRNDILAFLRWNLPELKRALGTFPRRLLIVGADDPFWRGGLSGPQSLYIHSERPLIGEDGTSTLLHELVHVATRMRAVPGDDWIVEGLAEFYSVEVLRRSGSVSQARADATRLNLPRRAGEAEGLTAARSAGAITALAVTLFYALDEELRGVDPAGLDAVVPRLTALDADVDFAALRRAVVQSGLTQSKALERMQALLD